MQANDTAAAAPPKTGLTATLDTALARACRFGATHWIVAVILAGLVFYLPCLDQRVIYLEEGRRAIQAINILNGSSWWILDVAGQHYVAKPPMLPLMMAFASLFTGGINEWSVRLPSILFIIIAAVCAGGSARVLLAEHSEERRDLAAFAAGFIFLTMPSIIERARIGETDNTVTGAVALGFLIFAVARERGTLNVWSWLGVTIAFAFAAFTKGPTPVAFAAIPILVLVTADRPRTQLLPAIAAIVIAMIPLSIWALLNLKSNEAYIWYLETRASNVTLLASLRGLLPLLYLNQVPRWLVGMLPWFILAMVYAWRHRDKVTRNTLLRALLLYAFVMSVVVLLWPGGRGRYALPAIVPIATLAGAAVAVYWDEMRIRRTFYVAGIALAIVAVLMATVLTGRIKSHAALRVDIAVLTKLMKQRPGGRFLVVNANSKDLNLLVYPQRPPRSVTINEIGPPQPGDTLLARRKVDIGKLTRGAWRRIGPIGTSGWIAYAPAE